MNQFEFNGEDYEEGYDEEAYEDDAYDLGESNLLSRVRQIPRVVASLMGRVPTTPYRGNAILNTPAGPANVEMPPDLVSKREFKALEEKVLANNRAILVAGKAIGGINLNTKKLEQGFLKNASLNRKKFQAIQQGQMFSALLPPKLTSLTTSAGSAPGKQTVTATEYDLMTTLLPMIVSGGIGGGSGKGDGSSNMNMMLPLILIMNDKDKASNTGTDNTLLMVMMMMMMNK